jgi:hypothetical protein
LFATFCALLLTKQELRHRSAAIQTATAIVTAMATAIATASLPLVAQTVRALDTV